MEVVTKKNLILVAGRGHPELSNEVAQHLHVPLGEVALSTFANGEIYCRYGENIRGADVFVFQIARRLDQRPADGTADHDRRREARVGEAHHRGVRRSTDTRARTARPKGASRSPRGSSPTCSPPRAPTASSPSTSTPGRSRASSTSPSTTSPRCRCSSSTSRRTLPSGPITVVAPDAGGGKLARRFADRLERATIAFIDKRRPKGTHNVAVATEVVGEIDGRTCVIVDDMIDTASTVVSAADLLLDRGATDVVIAATHGLLSGPAVDRLKNCAGARGRRHQHGARSPTTSGSTTSGALDRAAARRRDRRRVRGWLRERALRRRQRLTSGADPTGPGSFRRRIPASEPEVGRTGSRRRSGNLGCSESRVPR